MATVVEDTGELRFYRSKVQQLRVVMDGEGLPSGLVAVTATWFVYPESVSESALREAVDKGRKKSGKIHFFDLPGLRKRVYTSSEANLFSRVVKALEQQGVEVVRS